MSFEFKLPDIGEGIAEGEIVQWHVTEGQAIKEDDPFVEVMTDKATVEIPAPKEGTVQALTAAAGDTVPVGSVIAVIETAGAAQPAAVAETAASQPAAAAAAPAAPAPASSAPATPAPTSVPAPQTSGNGQAGRVLAAPAVRRRAREHGIDLGHVPATGPAGRVTRQDFELFLKEGASPAEPLPASPAAAAVPAAPAAAAAAPRAPAPPTVRSGEKPEVRVPLKGVRKRIAERMQQSKQTAAHFTYVDDVDVTELVAMRASLKETAAAQDVKLTYMPFIIQAAIQGLRKFPMLNATLEESTQEIVYKHYYNIGFAADTDAGLVVPVIHHADQMSLLATGKAVNDLAGRARDGKLSLDEVTGSTFTITNAGNIGGILATPVINYPEVAIMGVHKITEQAVVRDGEVVVRKMMNLSISLDHRVVDGADGARFMNEVIRLLEDPKLLLLGSL